MGIEVKELDDPEVVVEYDGENVQGVLVDGERIPNTTGAVDLHLPFGDDPYGSVTLTITTRNIAIKQVKEGGDPDLT